MRTLIIGLGNPILTDDGVGVKVSYEIERSLTQARRNDIDVTEASVGGLRLMELMIGYDRVILIDALVGQYGSKPGTIHQMTLEDLRAISPTQHSASAHDTSLMTALEFGYEMGFHLPEEINIFAIEVENVLDFGENPTPSVAEAIPKTTAAVLNQLGLA